MRNFPYVFEDVCVLLNRLLTCATITIVDMQFLKEFYNFFKNKTFQMFSFAHRQNILPLFHTEF